MNPDDVLPPRVLAVDPGEKRIGLAVSDPLGRFPIGLETLHVRAGQVGPSLLPPLREICERYEVRHIVMGLPIHMSGEEGVSAGKARELAALISHELNLPVTLMDERLTSKIAERSLEAMGIRSSQRRRKGMVDQGAAMRLLQDYLDQSHRAVAPAHVERPDIDPI